MRTNKFFMSLLRNLYQLQLILDYKSYMQLTPLIQWIKKIELIFKK